MKKIPSSEIRTNWKSVLDDVYKNKEVVYVMSHEREIAAVVPLQFAEMIEELIKKGEQNGK